MSTPPLPTMACKMMSTPLPPFPFPQGYYDPSQTRFVSGNGDSDDIDMFRPFFNDNLSASYKLTWPYSNPNYTVHWERFENATYIASYTTTEGNVRYEWSARLTINSAHHSRASGYFQPHVRKIGLYDQSLVGILTKHLS